MAGSSKRRRPGPGRPFQKGQSGNPSGISKRPKSFGARIRELTEDNEELIRMALSVARGEFSVMNPCGGDGTLAEFRPNAREVMDAVKWLASYSVGQPPKEEAKDEAATLTNEQLWDAVREAMKQQEANAPSSESVQ